MRRFVWRRKWLLLVTPTILLMAVYIFVTYQYMSAETNKRLTQRWEGDDYIRRAHHTSSSHNATSDLLIFSYMRSGSTLTGNILAEQEGSFYTDEPLIPFAPYGYFTESEICDMGYKKCSKEPTDHKQKMAVNAVMETYTCNFRDAVVLQQIVAEKKSMGAWQTFAKCIVQYYPKSLTHILKNAIVSKVKELINWPSAECDLANERTLSGPCICYNNITQSCRSSKLRMTKVLRLSMSLLTPILVRLPHLKVLYLTRDPRAILNSRIRTNWFPVDENDPVQVTDNVESMCDKFEKDVEALGDLQRTFPGRIMHIHIEQLLDDSEAYLRSIFGLVGRNVTDHVRMFVARELSKPYFANFTTKWTHQLNPLFRAVVKSKCANVMQFFRYHDLK